MTGTETLRKASARKLPLAQRIVWARKQKGISQERLAERIGTSRRHMIRIEKGQHTPGPVLRKRIAEVTEQADDFFAVDDDEEDALPRDLVDAMATLVRELSKARAKT